MDIILSNFCEIYNLKNLIKEPTCFKNPEKPSNIDLILTNRPKCFQNSCTYETEISDFHKMTITVMKVIFKKQKPKIIFYRSYKNFENNSFKEYLTQSLERFKSSDFDFEDFRNTCLASLNKFAPLRKNILGLIRRHL